MDYYGNLKKKLKKIAKRQIIVSLAIVTTLLIFTFILANNIMNKTNVTASNKTITKDFQALYDKNYELINSHQIDDIFRFGNEKTAIFNLRNLLNRFNTKSIAETNILVHDNNFNLIYSSYSDKIESTHRENYTKAILNTISKNKLDDAYNSIYKIRNRFPDLMISRNIQINNEILGHVSIFVSGYEWSYYQLSTSNTDSIITDDLGNIIFYTRPLLLSNTYNFKNNNSQISINNKNFYTAKTNDPERNFIIHSLLNQEDDVYFLFLFLSTLIVGILWYHNSNKVTSSLIDRNIDSVNLLIEQINSINKSDYAQRIKMNTEDEYEIIEKYINEMLDRLTSLNIRNTELMELNNIIEMKQLMLQYHPHFLYNTLEIIRYSIYNQPEVANDLILKLTGILKYSVENPLRDVLFKQDFKYIQDYLDIQKLRFSDKFNFNLKIESDVYSCIIPKLLLQPVIENSIKHGFRNQYMVDVEICAKLHNKDLIITIQDNGPGMTEDELMKLNDMLSGDSKNTDSEIGLYNIARRLQLHYSKTSGITVKNNNNGLLVTILIDQKKMKGVNEDVLQSNNR